MQVVVNNLTVGIYYNPPRQDLQERGAPLLVKAPVQHLDPGKQHQRGVQIVQIMAHLALQVGESALSMERLFLPFNPQLVVDLLAEPVGHEQPRKPRLFLAELSGMTVKLSQPDLEIGGRYPLQMRLVELPDGGQVLRVNRYALKPTGNLAVDVITRDVDLLAAGFRAGEVVGVAELAPGRG